MIYSFDVFDTVVTRVVAHPTDIFLMIAQRIKQEGLGLADGFADDFMKIRMKCESEARKTNPGKEIKYVDIYARMAVDYELAEETCDKISAIELDIESSALTPIAWTIEKVAELRDKGNRIIFVSDMYLDEDFIRGILKSLGIYRNGDGLYVSSRTGLTKGSGRLYELILEKEGIPPVELCHCGDSLYSDIYVPAKMGINIYRTTAAKLRVLMYICRIYMLAKMITRGAAKMLIPGRNA